MIVLVTYYGADDLDRLWASVCALDYPRDRYRLLVIENGPERQAARWFSDHAPAVRVLVPGGNTGYAGGCAIGMREALAAGADYVAIMTQDTEVDPGWLRELTRVAEEHPRAGAVQPKLLRRDDAGRLVVHSWGNELHYLGVGYVGGDGAPDRELTVRAVGYASGAGVLYRSSALREVGLCDPELFMYHEDTDLSWRLRLAGWEVLLGPRAIMQHHWEFDRGGSAKLYLIERNRLVNLLTHYRVRTLLLVAPALVLLEICSLGFAGRHGWLRRRLGVYVYLLRASTRRYLAAKRRSVQAIRRVPDRAVAAHLTGRIDAPFVGRAVLSLLNPLLAGYWRLVRPLIAW